MPQHIGFDWCYFVAGETDHNPGPTYTTEIHNYEVKVYRRALDKKYHVAIEVAHGKHAGRVVYYSTLDPHYPCFDDPHRAIEFAEQRLVTYGEAVHR